MKNLLFSLIASFLIAGCLPSPPDTNAGKKTFSPKKQHIQIIKLTDSANRAIDGADITMTKVLPEQIESGTSFKSSEIIINAKTDQEGYFQINDLTPGKYQLLASVLGTETTLIIDIY